MRWILSFSLLSLAAFLFIAAPFHTQNLSLGDGEIVRSVGPDNNPPSDHGQQLWWIPVQSSASSSSKELLETMVYAPPGPGPFPLVIINHGKPTPGSDLRAIRPGFHAAALWFVEHGFIVAVPLRRGYGRSQGTVSDMVGTCTSMDYIGTATQTAMDIEGAIEFMKQESVVDASHVVVVGHSHGGFGALAVAADDLKGVIGIINFAGGTGVWKASTIWELLRRTVQGKICNGREHLLSALRQLGERNTVPQMWLYAENDETFNPELALAMLAAYREKSRFPVLFVDLPPSKKSGHMLFEQDDVISWTGAVNNFLKKLNIPGYRANDER